MRRGISSVSIALVALMAAAMLQTSAATIYFVGNTTGWVVPPNATFYSNWASQYTFAVNDTLVFNYAPGRHDVAEVTKANYDSCNKTSPIILYPNATGVTNVTLNKTGDYYFICTVGDHCASGQKLPIKVSTSGPTASPPASPPAPTPSGTSTPPPSASPPSPTPQSSSAPPPSGTPSPPPPPSSSSPGSQPPPPPPSAAPPKIAAAFTAVMSIAVGLLC
ncbi:hypothetical protein NMG60_11013252 [Bertholletia excelsa]